MSIRKLLFIFITCPVFAENINLNWVVDNETYANTTCSYGNDVNLPAPPQKSGYTFVGWKVQNYIPVEYIYMPSGTYIDTKIGSGNFNYPILEFRVSCAGASAAGFMFCYTGDYNKGITFGYNWGNRATYGRDNVSSPSVVPGYTYSQQISCIEKAKTFRFGGSAAQTPLYVDNILVATFGDTVPDFTGLPITNTIKINTNVSANTWYFFKITEENGLVLFDGVPAKDLSGTPCMYDLVTNECFYASAGNITAGPEIE